ncbi:FAD synthase [Mycoplasma sp. OR1901]|uniref:FAD synthase n=1 Tax=Mycoplasma sp. OR1901 TaxID=2742195 RepID=UPI0015815A0F|nr:hypothetical protein [Mycoplasma sp. OR1901]QKT05203.1 hypothetical protein HTZ87_00560 [Mycoplasma sp. OR1901]
MTNDLLIYNLKNFEAQENDAFLIGAFESFHLGHYQLYKELLNYKGRKILINFNNDDTKHLFDKDIIYTNESKYFSILELEFDAIIELNFSEIKNLDGIEFIKKIAQNKKVSFIAGNDFRFGKNAQYKLQDIPKYIENIEVKNIEIFKLLNIKISSSMIKDSLKFGDIDLANKLLVRNYIFNGVLKENMTLELPNNLLRMQPGIYTSFMHMNDFTFFSLLYINLESEYQVLLFEADQDFDWHSFHNKEVFVEVLRQYRKISDKNSDKILDTDFIDNKKYFLEKYSNDKY